MIADVTTLWIDQNMPKRQCHTFENEVLKNHFVCPTSKTLLLSSFLLVSENRSMRQVNPLNKSSGFKPVTSSLKGSSSVCENDFLSHLRGSLRSSERGQRSNVSKTYRSLREVRPLPSRFHKQKADSSLYSQRSKVFREFVRWTCSNIKRHRKRWR